MAGKLESAANADTMRGEKLVGRTQQMFFSPEEDENFLYPDAAGVDFDKKESFDAADMDAPLHQRQNTRTHGGRCRRYYAEKSGRQAFLGGGAVKPIAP